MGINLPAMHAKNEEAALKASPPKYAADA